MNKPFEKTVMITGTSSGLGKASARIFAEKGWNVIAAQRDIRRTEGLVGFNNIAFVPIDLADNQSIFRAVKEGLEVFGSIDVLINNAGKGMHGIFEGTTTEEIEEIFRINVFGLMETVRAVLPGFRRNGSGTIVNISSMGGRIGLPLRCVYNSSKFAVEGFSEVLKYELAPFNIKVKVVEPGFVRSKFHQSLSMIRMGSVELYKKQTDRLFANDKYETGGGSTPEKIAQTVFKAATTRSKRLRYAAGNDARFLKTIHGILPFGITSGILAKANV